MRNRCRKKGFCQRIFPMRLLLTCEHAQSKIPARWQHVFRSARTILQSHRGWDAGALRLADQFSRVFGAPLISGKYSRLLIDLNRTPASPDLLSRFSRALPEKEKQKILKEIYEPYWRTVRQTLKKLKRDGDGDCVLHLSFHSFTPVLKGKVRKTDLGLLYDPARPLEVEFCRQLKAILQKNSNLRIHLNRPYRGTGDGVTAQLRTENESLTYAGVEIEVNKKLLRTSEDLKKISNLLNVSAERAVKKLEAYLKT